MQVQGKVYAVSIDLADTLGLLARQKEDQGPEQNVILGEEESKGEEAAVGEVKEAEEPTGGTGPCTLSAAGSAADATSTNLESMCEQSLSSHLDEAEELDHHGREEEELIDTEEENEEVTRRHQSTKCSEQLI